MANQRVVEVIENRFHLSKHLLTNVLQKLNDKQFDKIAIVSVIGPHFEGNTFTANLILNYLQRQNSGHTYLNLWPHDVILRHNSGFKSVDNYPDGQQKCPAIEMWSEPFIVRDGTTRVAVLLVNVQNFAYTLADLIRGDTSLIHMFRLISSVSTIVVINKPGLKKYPGRSGDQYKMWVNSYEYFINTLIEWENSDGNTFMANVSQINDRSDNYRKLNQEFNNSSTYLVSCPAYDVKNIDWKVGELSREYADQMKTFIRINALDVDNRLNGITFTNTDQLMKVIMGKIQELNHNNSVNTGPTHEPHVEPKKLPAPTRRKHQSSAVTAEKVASKYWAMNERKRNKTHTLIIDFECKPIGVCYLDQKLGAVNLYDPNGHLESNCVVFDGQNMLYGREAEQHLNGHTFDIKHIMGRDVTDDELNCYSFDFVDIKHLKVRLVFNNEMNIDLYIESLFALQVLDAKTSCEQMYENYMKNVLFIVPTNYTIRQMNAFRDAATIAGIEHVQFITEMTTVALNFGLNHCKYKRNIDFPDVLIILMIGNVCELALVEYIANNNDTSVKYNAYKRVDIEWPSSGADFSAVNNRLRECTQQLIKLFKPLILSKYILKIYHCYIVGDTEQLRALDFDFLNNYCSQRTMDDLSAIRIGAIYYSNYYETNGHNIPITGVMFRDIVCHISSGHKSKTLLYANQVPQNRNHVNFKLSRSDRFPITVRITEGPDSVIKEYVLSEYPTGSLPYQTLYIEVFDTMGANNTLNIGLQIDTNVGPSLAHWHVTQRNYSLTECQMSEQTELVANLVKPVALDTHNSPDKSTIDDCDYYSNNTNTMTVTTNETKSDKINKQTNERSKPVTKKRSAVTENELGAFVTKLIQKYTELISQLSNTCDPNTQVYANKSRDLRNRVMKEFDTEFGRKEPTLLVADQRLALIARLDTKDMECMTKAKEMMAKSDNKLQELVESCVKEFNDKMIAAIDEDIEMNGVDNNYNKIYAMVNKSITNLFNNRAISLSKREYQRKAYLSHLLHNISTFIDKFKQLYDCNERYRQICRQQIEINRNLPDVVLLDMQRAVDVPHVLLSNSQLMERLHKMYDKSYRYFTTSVDKIRHGEEQLVNTAIELTVVKYGELFDHVLMFKFYIPSDLNAIHNQFVTECLALLKQLCTFTTAQSDQEDMCQQKCEGQLSDTFTHIKMNYTAKLRRLFAINVNIVKDMHRKYCHNIDRHLATDFGDENQLQRLLETEFIDIMNTFAERFDPIGREWDRALVRDIEQKHRQSLNRVLFERMRDYRIANSHGVSSDSNAIPVPASPPVADPVQEFSQFCADIEARLETCDAIATKKRRLSLKLVECQQIVTTNANRLDEQKLDLLRLIDLFKLRDKLIIS